MKKQLRLFLGQVLPLLAIVAFVTACGNDENDDPTVLTPAISFSGISGESVEAAPGEEVKFDVVVAAPGGFNTIIVEKTVGTSGTTAEIDREARPAGQTTETYTYNFNYTPTAEEAGETIFFDFTAVDDDGLETTSAITVNVGEVQLTEFSAVLLAAPLNDGSSKTWFSTTVGEIYSSNEVNGTSEALSAEIDFGYFFGNTKKATIASPANFPIEIGQQNWTVRNSTKIKPTSLTASQFLETASSAAIEQAYQDSFFDENEGQVTDLVAGDVLVFMTASGKEGGSKKGLIHVEEVKGTFNSGDYIKINVKVIQ